MLDNIRLFLLLFVAGGRPVMLNMNVNAGVTITTHGDRGGAFIAKNTFELR